MKTGYTDEAKYCLTATAEQDDMRLVAVVMGAETVKERNEIIMHLMDDAFQKYETEKLYMKDEKVGEIKNLQSENVHYDVTTSEPLSVLHKKGERTATNIQTDIALDGQLDLPVTKGDKVGELTILENGEEIEKSALIAAEQIEQASLLTLWKRSLRQITKFVDN